MWDFKENRKETLAGLIEEMTEVIRDNLEKSKGGREDTNKQVLEVFEITILMLDYSFKVKC